MRLTIGAGVEFFFEQCACLKTAIILLKFFTDTLYSYLKIWMNIRISRFYRGGSRWIPLTSENFVPIIRSEPIRKNLPASFNPVIRLEWMSPESSSRKLHMFFWVITLGKSRYEQGF